MIHESQWREKENGTRREQRVSGLMERKRSREIERLRIRRKGDGGKINSVGPGPYSTPIVHEPDKE